MSSPGTVLLESHPRSGERGSWLFRGPEEVVVCMRAGEIQPALRHIQARVAAGFHAAGFIAYEAAGAFDPALTVRAPASELPLLWFGLYRRREPAPSHADIPSGAGALPAWTPSVERARYDAAIARIREYIRSGDTYQVNHTFRMRARLYGDPFDLYRRCHEAQESAFSAWLDLGRFQIACVSPELFFRLEGRSLETRPMKGTAPRGRWAEEDDDLAATLASSDKERAENVMIVDLLRNDFSRVAAPGSVCAGPLFTVERYPTVNQMTSVVRCETDADVPDILRALFPCGSVTGAPKVRTMQIIAELEDSPRGVYCGAIGWWGPDRQAGFNVAIRTAVADRERGTIEYGVGGGITWDSTAGREYEECLVKAEVLSAPERAAPTLLETLCYNPDRGYLFLERHLARLAASARYFNFPFDMDRIKAALATASAGAKEPIRVSLDLASDGHPTAHARPLNQLPVPLRIGFAREPVRSGDCRLFHKTVDRSLYDRARDSRPDCDDVILWNERDEATEGSFANLVAEIDGGRFTPPLECGLLPGVFRKELLKQGEIRERVLSRSDVVRAARIWLVNSVRGWIPAVLARG